ncbi:cytochrome P450 monooxygenase GliC2 [Xylariaceae sp. FL0804]|nr:cytochrome P450 monooxygenase GliC2 [Xylariaceae sp. FL0804]
MALFTWIMLALASASLFLILRAYGLWLLETTVSRALETFNTGVSRGSKPISGPKWQYPNGNVLERFINGRPNSEKWQKYGPVYRIWAGPHPEIVITTPEDLRVFSSDANDHGKPANSNMGWFLGEMLGSCMGLLGGQDWKRLRHIFNPAFTHIAAVSRIDTIEIAARNFVEDLRPRAEESTARLADSDGKKPFKLAVVKAFTKFPYFLTAGTIYGPLSDAEERELWSVTEKRLALNPYMFGGGFYRSEKGAKWFDAPAVRRLRNFNSEWFEYHARMVERRRSRGDKPPIVSYWEEYETGNMNLKELLHTMDELLIVNLDIFTHVLTWFITLVAGHDEVKRELREEVAENRDHILPYLAKSDTHLHRCFLESMRIRPFTIFTIGESSSQVKNFHGVLVKPNTQILVDVLGINVRNPFWGKDSELFIPSRFKTIKQSDLRHNFHVFGIGSRKCMGQYVAGHIAKAVVAHLFEKYEVEVSDGRKAGDAYDTDKSSWTPKADASLTLTRRDL